MERLEFWANEDDGQSTCCDDRVVTYGGNDQDDKRIGWVDATDVDVEGRVTDEASGWGITPKLVVVWPNKDGESACCDDGVVTCGGNKRVEVEEGWLDGTEDAEEVQVADAVVEVLAKLLESIIEIKRDDQ